MSRPQHDADIFQYAQFDLQALLRLAERLRNKPCSCDLSQKPISSSFNWVIHLAFDDGVEWVFRSPRRCRRNGLDEETAGNLLASEAATLKYIRENSSIPVPDVFFYSCTKFNIIGVPFILMSKAQGSPLSMRIWQTHSHATPNASTNTRRDLANENKEKVMKQLGTIVSQLSRLRLGKIGSLFEEEGYYTVKPCLSPGNILHQRNTLQELFRGPFNLEQNYYKSLLTIFRLHIQHLPMEHHVFFAPVPLPQEYPSYASYLSATDRWNDFVTIGAKVDSGENRLQYFIVSQFLEDMIPYISLSQAQKNGFEDGYPIRHPNLSINNIFVDDDCNITCIIDWAFASSVPISELLTTPGLPHPTDRLEPSLVAAFRAGFIDHFIREGNVIHQTIWETADKVGHFLRLVNLDALQDYNHFAELYPLVFGHQAYIPTTFKDQYGKAAVSSMARTLSSEDQLPHEIKRDEDAYFSAAGPERRALSTKLTIASELNQGFVADRRLWHWIGRVSRFLDNTN